MKRTLLSIALSAALLQAVHAQDSSSDLPPTSGASVPISYVGSNARLSLGVDDELDATGELLLFFGGGELSTWMAEGWLGQGDSGGVKLGYHWLWGGLGRDAVIADPGRARVAKAFLAVDQNPFSDRKATVGFGWERESGFLDLYLSRALTDERLLDINALVESRLLNGIDVVTGRPYRQTETTTTTTTTWAKPYDWGIGLRGGRFFEPSLLRLRMGLDHERGDFDTEQTTVSLGLDKHFSGSPHSLSLDVEAYRKKGRWEADRTDTRAWLLWRWDFGKGGAFRPTQPMQQVERTREITEPAPAPVVVRNEISVATDTLFEFDSARVGAPAESGLMDVLEAMKGKARVSRIELVGHTCDIGPEAYNQTLSERRAKGIFEYLVSQGVPAGDIDTRGEGERSPKVPNDSDANRARNRRVEISFLTVEERTETAPTVTRTVTEWVQEPVAAPPAWIERALRNPARHKRTVDVYRFETETVNVIRGPVEFVNRAPVAIADAVQQQTCAPLEIDVLANDTDPDGDSLQVVAVGSTSQGGSVAIQGDGRVRYTPPAGGGLCSGGQDSFSYTIADPSGLQSTATVSVTFTNVAPVAQDDAVTTPFGTSVVVDVLSNDSDADGDALSVASVTQPANGSVTVGADGRVNYVPAAGFAGVDTFTYTVTDGTATATATVQVTVEPQVIENTPPVAQDDAVTTPFGTSVVVDVLSNDSDADGDALSVASVTQPANGSVTVGADGRVNYVPAAGFAGVDTFTYTVTDGTATATATVQVTVEPQVIENTPPVAQDDAVSTPFGTSVVVDVLSNDSDADGDALSVASVTQPANGSVTVGADGRVNYVPAAGFAGVDTFTYTVTDGTATATATVQVTVEPQVIENAPPVAQDDAVTTPFGTSAVVDVLSNDSDADGDALSVASVTQPANGSVTVGADGRLSYMPGSGFAGVDTFTYTVTDGTATATATVQVTVEPQVIENTPPVAQDDAVTTPFGTSAVVDVLSNDSDADGDALSVASVTQPANGSVTVGADGRLSYMPVSGFAGVDTFTYTVTDGTATATATVQVTVEPEPAGPNSAPVARDDLYYYFPNQTLPISPLDNDSDPDGDPLRIVTIEGARYGRVEILDGGLSARYIPGRDFRATERLTYTISDGRGGTATAFIVLHDP